MNDQSNYSRPEMGISHAKSVSYYADMKSAKLIDSTPTITNKLDELQTDLLALQETAKKLSELLTLVLKPSVNKATMLAARLKDTSEPSPIEIKVLLLSEITYETGRIINDILSRLAIE